eukprot:gene15990-22124_t
MKAAQQEVNKSERQFGVLRNQPPPMAGPSHEKYEAAAQQELNESERQLSMLCNQPPSMTQKFNMDVIEHRK